MDPVEDQMDLLEHKSPAVLEGQVQQVDQMVQVQIKIVTNSRFYAKIKLQCQMESNIKILIIRVFQI